MDCDICTKSFTASNGCTCVVCARNSIYPLRIEQATVLIEKEKLGRQVESVLKGTTGSELRGSDSSVEPTIPLRTSTGGTLIDRYECAKKIDIELVQAEAQEGRERVQMSTDKADELRRDIERVKKQRATKQAAIAKKRSEIASATHGLEERREKEVEHVRRKINSIKRTWDVNHDRTADARAYLCREAALLMGLKHAKRRSRDGSVKDVYYLGQNKIFDLRDLHLAQPDPLCSSLNNVAMLLVRVSHYLAVRLPHEITVPHRDYPRPTIFNHHSSYLGRNGPFPGSTLSQSTSTSPEASRSLEHDQLPLPHPRPLYIDRPLPQLMKEDPTAYVKFLEGVCLLAWDVAWLCKSQGLPTDFSNWEEMCAIGRNLYALLITQPVAVPLNKDIARVVGKPSTPSHAPSASLPAPSLGHLSHGTAHSFLDVAGASKMWRLAQPAKLADSVKTALLAEMQGAEWEVLKEDEWAAMETEMREDPVVVGPRKGAGASLATIEEAGRDAAGESGRESGREERRGVNGWMKLKSRSGE